MVDKRRAFYVCRECGSRVFQWQGQCLNCLQWNTFEYQDSEKVVHKSLSVLPSVLGTLPDVTAQDIVRIQTGLPELDRVLGGGLVRHTVILIGGDPGIGKSTLLLQAVFSLEAQGVGTLYVTGEESLAQVAMRAHRLNMQKTSLRVLSETSLERIIATIQQSPVEVVVIDSIQTMCVSALGVSPGSVAQVKESAVRLVELAKQHGYTIFIVGHVNKEGAIAGPRVLEHMVDTVLYFEGDTYCNYRIVRACKNRFGAVQEIGIFAMTERGLKEVANPSALFLSQHDESTVSGTCVMVMHEATRPLLVEIQALVCETHVSSPRRLTVGVEQGRLAMLLAVLHRYGHLCCLHQDVFVNVVGGVRVTEPAADLAVLLAVVSSVKHHMLPVKLMAFGEIGLVGEIRPAPHGQERLKEAIKLGCTHAILPAANVPKKSIAGCTLYGVSRVEKAIEWACSFMTGTPVTHQ